MNVDDAASGSALADVCAALTAEVDACTAGLAGLTGQLADAASAAPYLESLELVTDLARTLQDLQSASRATVATIEDILRGRAITEARSVHPDEPRAVDWLLRETAAELAARLIQTDRGMVHRLDAAHELVTDYAATHRALAEGRISEQHANEVRRAGTPITDPDARKIYEHAVLDYAESASPARTRAFAKREAERHATLSLGDRHEHARAERHIRICELDDGMCQLSAMLPAVEGYAIHDRIAKLAHASRGDGDARTIPQRQADLFIDVLLTSDPAETSAGSPTSGRTRISAHVYVTVPARALVERGNGAQAGASPNSAPESDPEATDTARPDDRVALLDGHIPIAVADAAELLARAPSFTRVLTDPTTGIAWSTDTYRPTRAIREHLTVRDAHCRFPGCRTPVRNCDIDHTTDWQHGGSTTSTNLAALCRRHHTLKHRTRWTPHHDREQPGVIHWTTPTGRTLTDTPEPPGPRPRRSDTST